MLDLLKGTSKEGEPVWVSQVQGKSALQYKLGVDILAGNLVRIQGPYPAGAYPNIMIFNKVLAHFLKLYERVWATNGYRRHAKVKCPQNNVKPVEKLMMQG